MNYPPAAYVVTFALLYSYAYCQLCTFEHWHVLAGKTRTE
jgi:hypothetical protein